MSVEPQRNLSDEILQRLVSALKSDTASPPEAWDEQLDLLFDDFVEELSPGLQSIVPVVEPTISARQLVKFAEARAAPGPALYVLANQEEQGEFVLLRFGAAGVNWWLIQALGGSTADVQPPQTPGISTIGARVARIAVDLVLGSLVRVLSPYGIDVAFHETKMATDAEDVPVPEGDPWAHHIILSIAPDVDDIALELLISESLVSAWCAAIKLKGTRDDSATQGKSSDSLWSEGLSQQLEGVPVSAEAVLCRQSVDLNDVAMWRPGQVLTLDVTADKPVELVSNGVPLFWGALGKKNGKLCVRLGNGFEDSQFRESS